MKKIFFTTFLLIFVIANAYSQKDTLISAKTGMEIRPIETVTIINGVLFDSLATKAILRKYDNYILKIKFYSNKEALKKWGISSRDGVVFITIQDGIILDLRSIEIKNKE
jgi:hypothetical protein